MMKSVNLSSFCPASTEFSNMYNWYEELFLPSFCLISLSKIPITKTKKRGSYINIASGRNMIGKPRSPVLYSHLIYERMAFRSCIKLLQITRCAALLPCLRPSLRIAVLAIATPLPHFDSLENLENKPWNLLRLGLSSTIP